MQIKTVDINRKVNPIYINITFVAPNMKLV